MSEADGPIRRGAGTPFDVPRWHDIEPIYDLALVLPPDGRAAYLEGATFGDAELRREIERLLEATPMPRAAQDTPVRAAPQWDAATAPSLVGQQLSPYWLDLELVRSADSVAYVGTRVDPFIEPGDTTSRRVVVRVAHLPLQGDGAAQQLRERRDRLSAIAHPSLVRLLDAATTVEGRPYVVSDFAYGTPVTVVAADRSLDMNSRLSLFLQAADAITHLHGSGVAHGALRTSTLLVDSMPMLRVVDAGLAPMLSPDAAVPAFATAVRRDVRALGSVLYELLSGVVPQDGAHVPPMSHAARGVARAWERRLRGDMDAVVAAAIDPDDAKGYQTMSAFADDVRRFVAGYPVQVRPADAMHRVERFVSRNAVYLLAGTAMAAIAAFFAITASRRQRLPVQPLALAVATRDTAVPVATRDTAVPAPVNAPAAAVQTPPAASPPPATASTPPATATPAPATPTPAPAARPTTASTPAALPTVPAPTAVAAPAGSAAAPSRNTRSAVPAGGGTRRRVISELASLDSMSPEQQGTPAVRRRYAIAFSRLAALQAAAGDARDALSSSRRAHALWQGIADSNPADAQALRAMEVEVQRIRRLAPRER